MKNLLALIILFSFLLSVSAEDWPLWRGSSGDGISKETGILKKWPSRGPKKKWSYKLGNGFSGISVANGLVYTLYGDSSYEYCLALKAKSGRRAWFKRLDRLYSNSFGDGPRTTPIIDSGKVYAVSAKGKMWCLNAKNGKTEWRIDLVTRYRAKILTWGISATPIPYKHMLLYNVGGSAGKSIVAFNKKNGRQIWAVGNDTAGYSTPILAKVYGKTQAIFFTARGAVGLDPDNRGKILWRYRWRTSYDVNAATPIFRNNHVYISSGYDSGASVFKIVRKGRGFTTKKVWYTPRMKNHFSSSILYGDHIYGFHNKILTCMVFDTGKTKWKRRGFSKGSLVGVDGHMIILGEKGTLALAELNPNRYIQKGRTSPLGGTKCWTVPTVANGLLFIRNEEKMICYDVVNR